MLFIKIDAAWVVNKVPVAIHASFFISRPCINHCPMRKHSTPTVGNVKKIPVAFLTLLVLKGSVCCLAILLVVVFLLNHMNDDILDPMERLRIEEIVEIMRSREVAVHAVGDGSLSVVHVCGCLPGVVGELDLMAGGAKLGRRGPDHRIVGSAEDRKAQDDPNRDKECNFILTHGLTPFVVICIIFC